MKVIPLSKVKAQLSRYARICRKEPVVVTVNGVPAFQLVPITEKDDLIDSLIQHHPKFRGLLRARLRERSVTAAEAARRL